MVGRVKEGHIKKRQLTLFCTTKAHKISEQHLMAWENLKILEIACKKFTHPFNPQLWSVSSLLVLYSKPTALQVVNCLIIKSFQNSRN